MSDNTLIKNMLDNAVHIGYKREFWSPKMRDYIYGTQNGVHVFDLSKTAVQLESMKKTLAELSAKGKTILIVGTKIQAQKLVKELAEETGNFYINNKWVPGFLTNFSTLKKRIAAYNKIEKEIETGALEGLTKKEKAMRLKELEKLQKAYSGVKDIKRTPDAVFIIDGRFEALSVAEANKMKIPSFALLGSTGDIDSVTHFVPCNVNSMKSLSFILKELAPALKRTAKTTDSSNDNTIRRLPPKENRPERDGKTGKPLMPKNEKVVETAETQE